MREFFKKALRVGQLTASLRRRDLLVIVGRTQRFREKADASNVVSTSYPFSLFLFPSRATLFIHVPTSLLLETRVATRNVPFSFALH